MNDSTIQTNPGWSTRGLAGAPLGQLLPEDEYLHPLAPGSGYASTETSYWGFCVPARRLMCEIYIWFHPVLNTMSAGVLLFTGKRRTSLAADYVHHHHFLPMPAQIADYRIPEVGLSIEVIEPLKRIRIRHRDPQRDVGFDILFEAALPPVGRPNGKHLIQVMHTTGELNLYGERIAVDDYFTRDRSWGAERYETPQDVPPITWMTGNAGPDLAFHLVAFDDPADHPEWLGRYTSPEPGGNLMWGFLQRGGALRSIRAVRKLTHRGEDGVTPVAFDITIEPADGEPLTLHGEVVAQAPWATWQNVVVWYSLTRWVIDGREAWGDCQDIHYNRYVHEFSREEDSV